MKIAYTSTALALMFGLGMAIPSGPLAFASRHPPEPLSELDLPREAAREPGRNRVVALDDVEALVAEDAERRDDVGQDQRLVRVDPVERRDHVADHATATLVDVRPGFGPNSESESEAVVPPVPR